MMNAALIVLLTMTCSGCAHYKVISADRQVHRLKAGRKFRPPVNGWFVPDATWKDMREAIADRITDLEAAR